MIRDAEFGAKLRCCRLLRHERIRAALDQASVNPLRKNRPAQPVGRLQQHVLEIGPLARAFSNSKAALSPEIPPPTTATFICLILA